MNDRTPAHKVHRAAKRGSLSLLCLLLLVVALLVSCSRKDHAALNPSPGSNSSPGASPVVQLSPDTSATGDVKAAPDRKHFKTGEVVPAGYLGYKVYRSWFSDRLSNHDPSKKSTNTTYLFVDLSVVNTDKKERPVSPLKLVDEKGKQWALSEKAAGLELSVAKLGQLGSSVSRRALAIFEVASGHQYQLKIRGFTNEDVVLIELSPAATAPAQ